MLKMTLVNILLRCVPETLLSIWAIYLLNFKKINIRSFTFAWLTYLLCAVLVTFIPIDYGEYNIILIFSSILISICIIKITITKAIASSLIMMILLSICEFLNIRILKRLFNVNIHNMRLVSLEKIICRLPALLLFALIFLIFNQYIYKKKKLENTVF